MRRREALQALAVAIALHAVLIAALPSAVEPPRGTAAAAATAAPSVLDIRSLEAPTAPAAAPPPVTLARSTPAPQATRDVAERTTGADAAPDPAQAPLATTPGPLPTTLGPTASTQARTATGGGEEIPAETDRPVSARIADAGVQAAGSLAVAVASRDPPGSEEAAPVYATAVPGDFRWTYTLKRGLLSGTGELWLRTQAGRYELDLRGTALGMEIIGMSSRGGFDAAGFAPERFVDRRRGRDRLAANFDRVQRRITYSGPASEHPLAAGTQDRLSWMVQLAAIVQAAPHRFGPGARITVPVSGARADLDLWTFSVRARQAVDTPAGPIAQALMLMREPRRPYDTQVEVWLDPSRQHLPVRARMTVLPGGETLELTWSGG